MMKMHQCNFCDYQSSRNYNLKVHVKNKHSSYKAPTNTPLQPKVAYSSTEIPQHLTSYQLQSGSGVLHTTQQYDPRSIPQIQYNEINHQGHDRQHLTGYQVRQGVQSGSGVLHTTQQYDPRAKPQIQYNEVKHKGQGPQTSANYSVTQKTEDTDNETDTETVSEADTENISDVEEHDIYEVINDIHLAFNHLKDLREQYGKALPQLKQLDEEEMDQFLYKYAELKIDIIDEQDGLEGKKVQTGSGLDEEYEEYEGDTDEEAVDEEGDTDEETVGEDDEEAVDEDDEEAMDEEDHEEDHDGEKVKEMCIGCLKERFFDFIFEAEEFMTPDSHKKRLHYEKIFRDDIKEAIEKDESNKPEDIDEMLEDVEHLHNKFDKDGNICFKYCSKRKINSISDMTDVLLDKELSNEIKKTNPSKFRYIKELLKPYRKSIRKLRDPNVDIHEKRKLLQKPDVGEGLLESVESVVSPLLKKKRK